MSAREYLSPGGAVRFSRSFSDVHTRESSVRFALEYLPCRRTPGDFRTECIRAAEEIFAQRTAPIQLHLSGGIDSEVMARSFIDAGVPFKAISFEYKCGNEFDLKWARAFCKKFEIEHDVIPFNEIEFVALEGIELMRSFRSRDLFPAFDIKRVMMTEGYAVLGSGEPQLIRKRDSGEVALLEIRGDSITWEWQAETGAAGCLQFFRSSPELVASFLRDPLIAMWIENADRLRMSELGWWKFYAYKRHWPDLVKRPKWTGYEAMRASYLPNEAQLQDEFSSGADIVEIGMNEFAFVDVSTMVSL